MSKITKDTKAVILLAILALIGTLTIALVFSQMNGQLSTTSNRYNNIKNSPVPTGTAARSLCLTGCQSDIDACEQEVVSDQEQCYELTFEDGQGNCYGPDGQLYECNNPFDPADLCEQVAADQSKTCLNTWQTCIIGCPR